MRYCGRSPMLKLGESGMSSPVGCRMSSSPNVHVRRVSMKLRVVHAGGRVAHRARARACPSPCSSVALRRARLRLGVAARRVGWRSSASESESQSETASEAASQSCAGVGSAARGAGVGVGLGVARCAAKATSASASGRREDRRSEERDHCVLEVWVVAVGVDARLVAGESGWRSGP